MYWGLGVCFIGKLKRCHIYFIFASTEPRETSTLFIIKQNQITESESLQQGESSKMTKFIAHHRSHNSTFTYP